MLIEKPAPAKLNLNLHITGRREDGYHILDSLMVFTQWGDKISIAPSQDEMTFSVSGPFAHIFNDDLRNVGKNSPNLIIQAVHALCEKTGNPPHFTVHLEKNIPSGAGLGGGSSDAAATMHALNELWGHPLSLQNLCEIGLSLGADLPICLHQKPSQVQGIGEIITPTHIPPMPVVMTWPETSLLTPDVFRQFHIDNNEFAPALSFDQNITQTLQKTWNSLQKPAISLCPEIHTIITRLEKSDGCQFARMTGSGSACFGIFNTIENALQASKTFKNAITSLTL